MKKLLLVFGLVIIGAFGVTSAEATNSDGLTVCEGACHYRDTQITDLEIWGLGFSGQVVNISSSDTKLFIDGLYRLNIEEEVSINQTLTSDSIELIYTVRFVQAQSYRQGLMWVYWPAVYRLDLPTWDGLVWENDFALLNGLSLPNEHGLVQVYRDINGVYIVPYPDVQWTCPDYAYPDFVLEHGCGNHPYGVYKVNQEAVERIINSYLATS